MLPYPRLTIIYRDIFASVLFSPLSPSLSQGEFDTRRFPMSQNITLKTQRCLSEFKTGNKIWKCRMAKITQGENNPLYSICKTTSCTAMHGGKYNTHFAQSNAWRNIEHALCIHSNKCPVLLKVYKSVYSINLNIKGPPKRGQYYKPVSIFKWKQLSIWNNIISANSWDRITSKHARILQNEISYICAGVSHSQLVQFVCFPSVNTTDLA